MSQSLKRFRGILGVVVVVTGVLVVACIPAATKQGVNYQLSIHSIPLYLKAFEFLNRHAHYTQLARQITHGCKDDEARAMAIWSWTRQHIQPTPNGWPIIDDHVYHIIIRGHGKPDQMADVFTTLTTYAGTDAFWQALDVRPETTGTDVLFSFVRIDGEWRVFDVSENLVFRDPQGRLASIPQLLEHPEWIRHLAGPDREGRPPYEQAMARLAPFHTPRFLRAKAQMPLSRMAYEIWKRFGFEHEKRGQT